MLTRLPHLLALVFLAASAAEATAQDPIFSQYTATPVFNNPGMAGLFEGEVRVSTSFREQWRSVLASEPLRTYGVAAELRRHVGGKDFFVGTASAYRDESGAARFTHTGGAIGVGMQKYLGGGRGRNADYLGFGAQFGYGQLGLDPSDLWFSSNLDTTTLLIGETGFVREIPGKAFFDLSAGVNYAVVRRDYSFTVGVAGHHLNWPNNSLLFQVNRRLKPRITGLVAGELLLEHSLRLLPSAIVDVQGQSTRITAGTGLLYNSGHRGDAGFRFGTYARFTNGVERATVMEAIVLVAQVELNRFNVGVSYDVNTAAVGRAVDSRGAYELTLTWTRAERSRYRVACPKL